MGSKQRKSARLPGYDYRQPGAYFVTIVTKGRLCLFGEVNEDAVGLSMEGRIAEECWLAIPAHHAHVELDAFVIPAIQRGAWDCLFDG